MTRLVLLLPLLLLTVFSLAILSAVAAPSPQPAILPLRQTNRRAIVDRLHNKHEAPQRRTSAIVYPACPNGSPDYNAAVYSNSYNTNGGVSYDPAPSLEACLERCNNSNGCTGGDYGDGLCWLTNAAAPGIGSATGYSGFVINKTCATNNGNVPAGTQCCDY